MHTGCPWRDLPKAFDWKPATRCQKDTDATWTKKPGKSHFGYKLSINVDNKCKIIHRIETDTAPTPGRIMPGITKMLGMIRCIIGSRADKSLTACSQNTKAISVWFEMFSRFVLCHIQIPK